MIIELSMVNRSKQLRGMDGIIDRCRAGCIALAVYVTLFGSSPGDNPRVAVGPMVTAIGAIGIATGAYSFLRAASELTHGNNKRFLQQTSGVHVFNQGGEARVEHGPRVVFPALGQILMVIPGMVV